MPKARVPKGPPRVARRAWLLVAGALVGAGCAREDIELAPRSAGITTVVGVETTRQRYCEGHGPPLASRTATPCDPSLAPLFGNALCTCGDATFTAPLRADAFDSRDGPYVAPESGADIGINGQLFTTAPVDIRGALRVTGSGVLSIVAPFHIEHDFATRSDLAVTAGDMSVGGDLWVDGELIAIAPFDVAGDLRQSSGHETPAGVAIGGDYVSADFALPLPCPCGEAELLDIAALVAAGSAASDHRALDIAADAPYALAEGDALELPCGRFAFAGGYIAPGTAVTARGRVALFVDGDLAVGGSLGADLRAGDELDVFVGGQLSIEPTAQLGTPARPAALRIYVAGASELVLLEAIAFDAELYAPGISLFATSPQTITGSLLVAAYHAVAEQSLHHDRAAPLSSASEDACAGVP